MPNPGAKVRIGNWQEEQAYEADRKQLLKDARGAGATLSQRILAKVKHHTQRTKLTPASSDGFLRFNVPIVLQNVDTEGCLATDLDDKSLIGNDTRYACTTTRKAEPLLRSTWVLVPVPSKEDCMIAPDADLDVVHYGQRFVVQSAEGLSDVPLYLCSNQKSHTNLSRVTSHQDVYVSAKGNQTAIWAMQHAHLDYRPDMQGKPVRSNHMLLMVHQLTNTPLASTSSARVANDFGSEYEVCCHRYLVLYSKAGTAPEQPACMWAAVTGPAASDAAPDDAELEGSQ